MAVPQNWEILASQLPAMFGTQTNATMSMINAGNKAMDRSSMNALAGMKTMMGPDAPQDPGVQEAAKRENALTTANSKAQISNQVISGQANFISSALQKMVGAGATREVNQKGPDGLYTAGNMAAGLGGSMMGGAFFGGGG